MLRRRHYLANAATFYRPDGEEPSANDWGYPLARAITMHLHGDLTADLDLRGRPLIDDDLMLLINGWRDPVGFVIPDVTAPSDSWEVAIGTTAIPQQDSASPTVRSGLQISMPAYALVVLRCPRVQSTV